MAVFADGLLRAPWRGGDITCAKLAGLKSRRHPGPFERGDHLVSRRRKQCAGGRSAERRDLRAEHAKPGGRRGARRLSIGSRASGNPQREREKRRPQSKFHGTAEAAEFRADWRKNCRGNTGHTIQAGRREQTAGRCYASKTKRFAERA